MNIKNLLILLILLLPNFGWAETPTQRLAMYFHDIQDRNFSAVAGHFDSDQLREFRHMMEFYKDFPIDHQQQIVQIFFGTRQTVSSVQALKDVQFFAGVFAFMMRQAEKSGELKFDGVEVLGEVREGDDIVHLVTRNHGRIGSMKLEAMEVISLRKSGQGWHILMSAKIKGFPDQLRAAFATASNG